MPRVTNFHLLKQMPQPVLAIRKKVSHSEIPQLIGEGFTQLSEYIDKHHEILTDMPFVAYHNIRNIDPEKEIEVELGFPLACELPATDPFISYTIPESKKVFCMYRGNYEDLGPVYQKLDKWIRKKGYEDTNVFYEHYYNGPNFPPEEMLTGIEMYLR